MPDTRGPYFPGQGVIVQGKMYNDAGDLYDPTTVTVRWKKPSGTTGSDTADKISTGVYEYTIDTTGGPAGDWWYRFEADGAAEGANEDYFRVRSSQVL